MRREDAVVEHEIDASARDQSGELFEELQGLEDQVAGAVGPRGLEQDGKMMTVTTKGTNAEGKAVNNVGVFEKQS